MALSIVMAAAHKGQPQRASVGTTALFLSQKIDTFLRTLPMTLLQPYTMWTIAV